MQTKDFENILAALDGLSTEQKTIIETAIRGNSDLSKVLNIIESNLAQNRVCPHCASSNVKKWGTSLGLQRYRCYECRKTFNALTGTPLANLRKKDQWLIYARGLHDGKSIRACAKDCGIAIPTSFRWRHRFLKAATTDKPTKLHGITEADETYILESRKGSRELSRPARKRGGKATKRGISSEQIPILVARDRFGRTTDGVLPDFSAKSIKLLIGGVVTKENVVCIDGGNALWGFVNSQSIPYKLIPSDKFIHEKEPLYHVQNVNAYHSRFKHWMRRFNGVATKYLPSYLGWRRILEHPDKLTTPARMVSGALGRRLYQQ